LFHFLFLLEQFVESLSKEVLRIWVTTFDLYVLLTHYRNLLFVLYDDIEVSIFICDKEVEKLGSMRIFLSFSFCSIDLDKFHFA